MTEYLPQIFLAFSIQAMGVLSPGPGVALIMGVAISRGRLPSLVTAFGVACGAVVLAVATVLGIAVIFAQAANLMTVVRLAGAAYLVWLAWKAFGKSVRPPKIVAARMAEKSVWRTWVAGFALQLSNPKAIMFWLAIASVGGIGDSPPAVIFLFLLGAFLISFFGHGFYAILLSAEPVRRAYGRASRWVEAGLGCFFLFAGIRLALARG